MESAQTVDWFSPSNLIASYGAVLSTSILIWQLIEKRKENAGRIDVKMFPKVIALTYATHVGDWEEQLGFTITNKGKNERFLTSEPKLEARIHKSENLFLSLISIKPLVSITYPKKLAPGENIEPFYDLKTVLQELKRGNVYSIRAYVNDTLGKTYYSKWIKVQVLLDYVRTSK